MSPKIDYILLGRAVQHYKLMGFEYVEVPWSVSREAIEVTFPSDACTMMCERDALGITQRTGFLVGSAEQALASMDLPPGRYVACSPCFRYEPEHTVFYQHYFMKVELFDNRDDLEERDVIDMMSKSASFMQSLTKATVRSVRTNIGHDLEIGGVEVGSYGRRESLGIRPWVYGTGLALPRFSVAAALDCIDLL